MLNMALWPSGLGPDASQLTIVGSNPGATNKIFLLIL